MTDVGKLEALLKCPMSADAQHRLSLLARCLYYILIDTEHGTSMVASIDTDENREVARTVSAFMTAHGSWLTQQLRRINSHFDNKYVVSCSLTLVSVVV